MKLAAKQHNIMKKKSILLCIFISFLVSCQKESSKVKNRTVENHIEMSEEITILKEQLKKGTNPTIGDAVDFQNQYNDQDLKVEETTINNLLKNSGFKKISQDEFKNKIKLIFQREINYSSDKNYLYINTFFPCDRNIIYLQNNTIDYDGFFVFKNGGFVAPLYTIPELIDYRKKYPDIIRYEEQLPSTYMNLKGEKITINKWMNIDDLPKKRNENIQLITARNKYLFNDSKADFIWLQFHDEKFLESLVKTFGYTADKKLLEWYIKRNGIEKLRNNIEEYLKVFYVKTCDNQLIVHKETFDYMDTNPEKYSKEIQEVLDAIRLHEIQLENLSFTEKAKIVAYLLYFGEKHKEKTKMHFQFMGMFYEHSSEDEHKKYDEEFKKNKYYNLPNFQRLWEEAKIDGDGIGLDM